MGPYVLEKEEGGVQKGKRQVFVLLAFKTAESKYKLN
jgi:hypothetical protein